MGERRAHDSLLVLYTPARLFFDCGVITGLHENCTTILDCIWIDKIELWRGRARMRWSGWCSRDGLCVFCSKSRRSGSLTGLLTDCTSEAISGAFLESDRDRRTDGPRTGPWFYILRPGCSSIATGFRDYTGIAIGLKIVVGLLGLWERLLSVIWMGAACLELMHVI